MQRQDGAVRRGNGQLRREPIQLVLLDFAVVVSEDGGVEGDDAQPVDVVGVVDRRVRRLLPEQCGPEMAAVVMVAHRPDHLRTE
jgi:hypothetical protein